MTSGEGAVGEGMAALTGLKSKWGLLPLLAGDGK